MRGNVKISIMQRNAHKYTSARQVTDPPCYTITLPKTPASSRCTRGPSLKKCRDVWKPEWRGVRDRCPRVNKSKSTGVRETRCKWNNQPGMKSTSHREHTEPTAGASVIDVYARQAHNKSSTQASNEYDNTHNTVTQCSRHETTHIPPSEN